MDKALVGMVVIFKLRVINEASLIDDNGNGEAKEMIDWAVPAGITLSEIIVYGDDMDAFF